MDAHAVASSLHCFSISPFIRKRIGMGKVSTSVSCTLLASFGPGRVNNTAPFAFLGDSQMINPRRTGPRFPFPAKHAVKQMMLLSVCMTRQT